MKKILVGTDFSAGADESMRVAAELAAALGAELHVLHAMPDPSVIAAELPSAVLTDDVIRSVAERLEAAIQTLRRDGFTGRAAGHQYVGGAGDGLCQLAGELDIDVIVVGNRGVQGVGRVLGSVATRVSRHAPCHVLIAHTN
jgi:nucleotide-binding universal stress UspA family protein